jgi:hypothetical protein
MINQSKSIPEYERDDMDNYFVHQPASRLCRSTLLPINATFLSPAAFFAVSITRSMPPVTN